MASRALATFSGLSTPGLVWGLNANNLVPYTVAALKKFYEEFPEITETQFRMHELCPGSFCTWWRST